jgi:PAS domain S-box-containing protein
MNAAPTGTPRLTDVLAAVRAPGVAELLGAVPAFLWVLDAEGRTLAASDRLPAIMGAPDPLDLLDPADRHALLEAIRARGHGDLEANGRRPDGSAVRLALTLRPLSDAEAAASLVTGLDITRAWEASRREAELAERERALLADVPVVLYSSDPVTLDATYFSDSVERVTGFPAAALLGTPGLWLSRVHPADLTTLHEGVEELTRTAHVALEYRWQRADGAWRWFRDEGVLLRDAEGRPERIVGTWADVTERHEVEQALRRSEAHLRKAQELAQVGSWEFEVDSGTLRWSDQIFVILGRDPALGPPAFDEYMELVHPDDRECMQIAARDAIEKALPNDVQYRIATRRGERLVRSIAEPERDPSGRVVRVHGAVMDVTDRTRAEDELRRNEAMLRRAQELARMGSWAYDADRQRVEWSDGMFAITGRDRALGPPTPREFYELVHPDDVGRLRELVSDRMADAAAYTAQYRISTPQGVRHLRTIAEPIVVGGRATGMRGTLIDVTESMEREESLRRSEASLRKSQELAHIGSWQFAWPEKILWWSDETYRIVGRDRCLGPPSLDVYLRDHVHPDDREALRVELARANESGGAYDLSYRLVGPYGVRHVRSLGEPRRDEQGRTQAMEGTIMDVTERVLAEQALRASEERLDRALAGGRMGMWDWDVEAGGVAWDARWAAMLGYTQEELTGSYAFWRDHVHPEDLAYVESALAKHLEDPTSEYDVQYRMRTKGGVWIWTRSRGRISRYGADGRPARMTGVQFDVTEQREAAEAARKAEERARRAEHLASIGTLAAGLAHELNNPLGGILLAAGYAEQALDRRGAGGIPTAREGLQDVIQDAKRGGRIVADVLTFARAEPTERSLTAIGDLVARALASVQARAEELGASISVSIEDGLPLVLVNAGEIHQVLVNLLRNALDSRGGEPVHVRVSAERTGASVCLHVDDDGHGLSEHVRRHLFEPFFTTRRDQGGTGLGLSLSHGIVTTHGGSIEAGRRSPLGGARFTVSLPVPGGADNGEDPGRR